MVLVNLMKTFTTILLIFTQGGVRNWMQKHEVDYINKCTWEAIRKCIPAHSSESWTGMFLVRTSALHKYMLEGNAIPQKVTVKCTIFQTQLLPFKKRVNAVYFHNTLPSLKVQVVYSNNWETGWVPPGQYQIGFKIYLENRKYFASIGKFSLEPTEITCGVPQGSILMPLLFAISVLPLLPNFWPNYLHAYLYSNILPSSYMTGLAGENFYLTRSYVNITVKDTRETGLHHKDNSH